MGKINSSFMLLSAIILNCAFLISTNCEIKRYDNLAVCKSLWAESAKICSNLTVNGTICTPNGFFPAPSAIVQTLTGDTGGAVGPFNNNINILGSGTVSVTGNPGTNTLTIGIATQDFDVDNGADVTPVANIVQVSGLSGAGFVPSGIETHNGGDLGNDIFIEDRRWLTQYVVDPSAVVGRRGTFQTIQGAIDAAVAQMAIDNLGASIVIRPGIYTEDITFHANLHILGSSADGRVGLITIIGNHSYSDSGTCVIESIFFTTDSGDMFTINPGIPATQCIFAQKYCGHTNTGGRIANIVPGPTTFTIYAEITCQSDTQTTAIEVSDNTFVLLDSTSLSNSSQAPLINITSILGVAQVSVTAGSLNSQGDVFQIISPTGVQQAAIILQGTSASTPNGYFVNFVGAGGFAQVVSTLVNINSGTANNITGPGIYQYADIISAGPSNGIDINVIQQPQDWKPYATAGTSAPGNAIRGTAGFNNTQFDVTDGFVTLFSPFAAYISISADYLASTSDSFISVDTVTAGGPVTVTLPASPIALQTFTIKDGTGNASVINTITINGNGFTIDGAATQLIDTPFGSLQVMFNGVSYEIY